MRFNVRYLPLRTFVLAEIARPARLGTERQQRRS